MIHLVFANGLAMSRGDVTFELSRDSKYLSTPSSDSVFYRSFRVDINTNFTDAQQHPICEQIYINVRRKFV